jgi:hypothetical protein
LHISSEEADKSAFNIGPFGKLWVNSLKAATEGELKTEKKLKKAKKGRKNKKI